MSINAKRAERAGRMAKRRAGGSEDVIDELRRQYDRLTQSQKRIAEYIVDHPDRVAFSTVDQMAGQLGGQSVHHRALHLPARAQGLSRPAGAHPPAGARAALGGERDRQRELGAGASGRHRVRDLARPGPAEPAPHHLGPQGRGSAARKRHHRGRPPGLRGRLVQRLQRGVLPRPRARSHPRQCHGVERRHDACRPRSCSSSGPTIA